jgi:uncharacterized protein YjbJ (UPF0337 family)
MNRDQLEGNWKEFKGKVRQKWAELTNDDLDRIEGRREELVGTIQKRYGKAREVAEREVDEWINAQPEERGVDRGETRSHR